MYDTKRLRKYHAEIPENIDGKEWVGLPGNTH